MGTIPFPASLKPVVNMGYGFNRGSNVVHTRVQGGLARSALDIRYESVPFNINIITTALGFQVFWDFYDSSINHGANSFPMELDSGNGIETHQCLITSGPNCKTSDNVNWTISMKITAEKTPTQDSPFAGSLQALFDAYGEALPDMLSAYETLVKDMAP